MPLGTEYLSPTATDPCDRITFNTIQPSVPMPESELAGISEWRPRSHGDLCELSPVHGARPSNAKRNGTYPTPMQLAAHSHIYNLALGIDSGLMRAMRASREVRNSTASNYLVLYGRCALCVSTPHMLAIVHSTLPFESECNSRFPSTQRAERAGVNNRRMKPSDRLHMHMSFRV